jgi:hypothetical protein
MERQVYGIHARTAEKITGTGERLKGCVPGE